MLTIVDRRDKAVSMTAGEVVADLVGGRLAGAVVVGLGGSGLSSIVSMAEQAALEADLDVRVVRGNRLDYEEPYSSLEGVVSYEQLEVLLGSPSRRDVVATRQSLIAELSPGLLILEDAQWIDCQTLTLSVGLANAATANGCRMLVVHRPRLDLVEIAALDEALSRHQNLTTIEDLSDDEFRRCSKEWDLVDESSSEWLYEATAGRRFLVDALAEAEPIARKEWSTSGGRCPPAVVKAVQARTAHLNKDARALLAALSYGASLGSDELAELLGFASGDRLTSVVSTLADEGLLLADGSDIVPAVGMAVAESDPPVERQQHHLRFAMVLAERQGTAVLRAEHLQAAGGSRDYPAACLAAADELMTDAPRLALEWLGRAAEAGVDQVRLAARRTDAYLRLGLPHDALRSVEPLFRSEAPDRLDGLLHAANAFVDVGRSQQAARILAQVEPRLDGEARYRAALGARLCELASGKRVSSSGNDFVELGTKATDPLLTVLRSLVSALEAIYEGDIEAAVGSVGEAVQLEIAVPGKDGLPLEASAVALSVSMYAVDLSLAERITRSGADAHLVNEAQRRHRQLRTQLIETLAGVPGATGSVAQDWSDLGWGDRLLALGIVTGVARRSNDIGSLRRHQDQMVEVLMRPPDLISLPLLGEVMAGAARIGSLEIVSAARRARDSFLTDVGDAGCLHVAACWTDLQVLVAGDDVEAAEQLADQLTSLLDGSERLGSIISVMLTWCDVLLGRAEPEQVLVSGQALQRRQLNWEATRLVGAAAMRVDDETEGRRLLAAARELRAHVPKEAEAEVTLANLLSDREREVAELLLGGGTYKEIGARLFISPKTVEHHVARIRQRLNVTSRAEMIELLRNTLTHSLEL